MLGGPLAIYFFVLLGGLVLSVTTSSGTGILVLVALAMMCTALVYSVRELSEHYGDEELLPQEGGPMPRTQVVDYLDQHAMPYTSHPHAFANSAQELAKAVHVSGWRVAKTVVVRADEQIWMVVLPAAERIDWTRLRAALEATNVNLVSEMEMAELFPSCELGAEPPLGGLFHLPVLVDPAIYDAGEIVCPAGTHSESLAIPFSDYARVEHPKVAGFASLR